MGQEIREARFSDQTFAEFAQRVAAETALLAEWERQGRLRDVAYRLGFELEGWLVDRAAQPAPRNDEFLQRLDDPQVVPELARFNFEINDDPLDFGAGMFDRMQGSLLARWQHCEAVARQLQMQALSIGILPTLHLEQLNLQNISGLSRYRALNEQVFRLRDGKPIEIDIEGTQRLQHQHRDVMLEAAATSLQIHLQVGSGLAARAYNSAKIVSAATVAVGANSPYFLGRELWQETRIPLFEQAISVGGSDYSKRVTFGIRYARDSLQEIFAANRDRYPVLLPDLVDEPPERLAHLRLHNGTVWRWNRPLVGFDTAGNPHYRIEHRVIAAGTSAVDVVADAAFFVGMMVALMQAPQPAETRLPFEAARRNFYRAARHGLDAEVQWFDGWQGMLQSLILEQLLPLADSGLQAVGVPQDERERWLSVIAERTRSRRTGAAWQIAWVKHHGEDWAGLVQAYAEQQDAGEPVHRWT
jgi:gamma-glutamyl:cysteine ligase YbdK (ATP-grasp superfamily)